MPCLCVVCCTYCRRFLHLGPIYHPSHPSQHYPLGPIYACVYHRGCTAVLARRSWASHTPVGMHVRTQGWEAGPMSSHQACAEASASALAGTQKRNDTRRVDAGWMDFAGGFRCSRRQGGGLRRLAMHCNAVQLEHPGGLVPPPPPPPPRPCTVTKCLLYKT
jgi:hypothetical protein